MTKACIHLPPVPVEAGQKRCPEGCPYDGAGSFCLAFRVVRAWDERGEEYDLLRCSACHASERPEPELCLCGGAGDAPCPRCDAPTRMEVDAARAEVARLTAELRETRDALGDALLLAEERMAVNVRLVAQFQAEHEGVVTKADTTPGAAGGEGTDR